MRFVGPLLQFFSHCSWVCIRLPSRLPWRPGQHVVANLLVSWHRTTPAWRGTHPLTPACHEIIEPCSVPDCMLSWCSPNLFHSLIRGFVCRKGTDWAVPGGMTSACLLSCWCHVGFEWSDFPLWLCQLADTVTAFVLMLNFNKQLWASRFVILHVGSDTEFDLTALS